MTQSPATIPQPAAPSPSMTQLSLTVNDKIEKFKYHQINYRVIVLGNGNTGFTSSPFLNQGCPSGDVPSLLFPRIQRSVSHRNNHKKA